MAVETFTESIGCLTFNLGHELFALDSAMCRNSTTRQQSLLDTGCTSGLNPQHTGEKHEMVQ